MRPSFSWDTAKAARNLRKHGVTFVEASSAVLDPLRKVLADPAHSFGEERQFVLGRSELGRLLFVAYVERRDDHYRLIGARLATRRERHTYEEGE
jgi:uncharacterized DUF497 family protein